MDQKKLLLIVISVGAFLVVVIGAGLLLFAPLSKGPLSRGPLERSPAIAGAAAPVPSPQGIAPEGLNGGTTAPVGGQAYPGPGPQAPSAATEPGAGEAGAAPVDASAWLKDPSAVPAPANGGTTNTRGDVIIIYGERPSPGSSVSTSAAGDLIVQAPTPPRPTEPEAPVSAASGSGAAASGATPGAAPAAQRPATSAAASGADSAAKTPTASTRKTTKTIVVDEYWVQTGSFSTVGSADEAKKVLADKGLAPIVETREIDGKTYYRVRIGPYSSEPEAKYWLSLVKTIDGVDGWVAQRKTRKTVTAN